MSLTIKQAFEALSDACANGMKNPFFVMRRLKESFADVASKVVDASGDKVTVTQTLTEGTEIGSIKVNNNTTTLYAPEGGGYQVTTLFENEGSTQPDTINLSSAVSNFDQICIIGFRKNYPTFFSSNLYLAAELVTGRNIGVYDDTMYAWLTVTDASTLTNNGQSTMVVYKVIGIKY